jgi:hypothetical protein
MTKKKGSTYVKKLAYLSLVMLLSVCSLAFGHTLEITVKEGAKAQIHWPQLE